MANSANIYAIVIEPAVPIQRDQVHEIVKQNADQWFHGMADLWFVQGGTPGEWRDRLAHVFPNDQGKIFVFRFDLRGGWAYRGEFTESGRDWIKKYLALQTSEASPSSPADPHIR